MGVYFCLWSGVKKWQPLFEKRDAGARNRSRFLLLVRFGGACALSGKLIMVVGCEFPAKN